MGFTPTTQHLNNGGIPQVLAANQPGTYSAPILMTPDACHEQLRRPSEIMSQLYICPAPWKLGEVFPVIKQHFPYSDPVHMRRIYVYCYNSPPFMFTEDLVTQHPIQLGIYFVSLDMAGTMKYFDY